MGRTMNKNQFNAAIPTSKLIALVGRVGKGRRLYFAFYDFESLEKWVSRHPCKNERMHVYPIKCGKFCDSGTVDGGMYLFACNVVENVRSVRDRYGWCLRCDELVPLIDGGATCEKCRLVL